MDMEEKVTWLYQPVTWRTSHTLGPDDYDWSAMTEAQAAMIKEKFLNVSCILRNVFDLQD